MYLKTADCNADGNPDLIMLSPLAMQYGDMMGHIAIFFSYPAADPNNPGTAYVENADWVITSGKNYTWLGHDADCLPTGTIVIGVPGW